MIRRRGLEWPADRVSWPAAAGERCAKAARGPGRAEQQPTAIRVEHDSVAGERTVYRCPGSRVATGPAARLSTNATAGRIVRGVGPAELLPRWDGASTGASTLG